MAKVDDCSETVLKLWVYISVVKYTDLVCLIQEKCPFYKGVLIEMFHCKVCTLHII